jgi:hypothetical protein
MKLVGNGVSRGDEQRGRSPSPAPTRAASSHRTKEQHAKHKILGKVRALADDVMHQVILALRQPGDQPTQDWLEEPFRVLRGKSIGRHGEDHARPHHRRPPRPEPPERSRRGSLRADFRDAWCGARVAPGLLIHDYLSGLFIFLCAFFGLLRVAKRRRRKEESFGQKAKLQRNDDVREITKQDAMLNPSSCHRAAKRRPHSMR